LSSLYNKGKAQFVPEPTEVTKPMSSGFEQMLLVKILAKQGIIAEAKK